MVEGTQRPTMTEGPTMTDAEITSRVDELVAELTPAEKAGQLTQYFYFGLSQRRMRRRSLTLRQVRTKRPSWRRLWGAGRRDHYSLSPIRQRSIVCNGKQSREIGSVFRCCSDST